MLTEIPAEQFSTAVDTCASEILAEAGICEPPVEATNLAKNLGLLVAESAQMKERARFVRLGAARQDQRGTILVSEEPRPERRHWAIAHEVGECMAHRIFNFLEIPFVDIPVSAREQIANHLASALLLPRDWFSSDGQSCRWDLRELKRIYSTASHELIARRMLDMDVPVIVTLFDQAAVQWRRSNIMRRPPPLTSEESQTWRVCFELADATRCEGCDLPEGIEEVRCWPVHEPGWRREILRTDLQPW